MRLGSWACESLCLLLAWPFSCSSSSSYSSPAGLAILLNTLQTDGRILEKEQLSQTLRSKGLLGEGSLFRGAACLRRPCDGCLRYRRFVRRKHCQDKVCPSSSDRNHKETLAGPVRKLLVTFAPLLVPPAAWDLLGLATAKPQLSAVLNTKKLKDAGGSSTVELLQTLKCTTAF